MRQIFASSSGVFSEYLISNGAVRIRSIYTNVHIYLKLLIDLTVSPQSVKYVSDNPNTLLGKISLPYMYFIFVVYIFLLYQKILLYYKSNIYYTHFIPVW